MDLICEERPADSPFIERVWRSYSDQPGDFISIAGIHYELVITKHQGRITVTLRGPETSATPAYCPPDAEFIGIHFKLGTFIPHFPAPMLMNRCDAILPTGANHSFWLHGSTWEIPSYDNAETFVSWLAQDGLLVHDPVVGSVLQGQLPQVSLRTVQRRFIQATGLTQDVVYQINRARHATALLKNGVSILDTVEEAGYFDQPHLTRSLKRFIGQTPAQIMDQGRLERLSFLYNIAVSESGILKAYNQA